MIKHNLYKYILVAPFILGIGAMDVQAHGSDEDGGVYNESGKVEFLSPYVKGKIESLNDDKYLNDYLKGNSNADDYLKDIKGDLTDTLKNSKTTLSKANKKVTAYKSSEINSYIKENNFPNPTITKDSRASILPKNEYKEGKPIGIVVHETANPNSTIENEVSYMYRSYENAFVHAFVNKDKVIETADTNYLCWGAGANANPYFIQIELSEHVGDKDAFARSVNNDAFWIASKLVEYDLKPSLADDNNGEGTIISHNGVTKYWGGTDHTDPIEYFATFGYDMNQFYDLIETKYAELTTEEEPEPEYSDAVITANDIEYIATKESKSNSDLIKDSGVSAKDDSNDNLEVKVKETNLNVKKAGTYDITYSATGKNGKEVTLDKKIVVEAKPPVIKGEDATINVGDKVTYKEALKLSVEDRVDDLELKNWGLEIDTTNPLTYYTEFSVTNSNGLSDTKEFKITIVGDKPSEKPEESTPEKPSESTPPSSKPEESTSEKPSESHEDSSSDSSSNETSVGSTENTTTSSSNVDGNSYVQEKVGKLTDEDKEKATPTNDKLLPKTGNNINGTVELIIAFSICGLGYILTKEKGYKEK